MKEAQAKTTYLRDYQVPDFLIDETCLKFELFEDRTIMSSRLVIRRNPDSRQQMISLVLHGQALELLELSIDGKSLEEKEYLIDSESLHVHEIPDSFVLECKTLIRPQENTSLEGLYKSKKMFCTQCEAEGFRKITYYLDRPDVLSRFTTTIEADKSKYPVLLSNGNNIERGVSETDSGRHWITWQDPFKKPCYLFALVAGDLHSVNDTFITCSGREIVLQIFVEEKDLDKCDFAMTSLKKAMKWDEEVYGREYDLDIFMIVAVDDFNMGAMENKGLNIFNSSCVLAKPETSSDAAFQQIEATVAHEYFHNWSGNRVTCRDWFQLSLKEGFTVYRDSEFSADMGSRAVKRIEDASFLRTVQFAEDTGPMAHSVRPESYMEISNFYTVTIYEKGAEVVRMIAQLLGPEKFRKGTDLYFDRFDGMAVSTEDFVQTMEEVSGLDLTRFRLWYSQAGTPKLKITEEYQQDNQSYCLIVEQSCPATPSQPVKKNFYIPLTVGLLDANGKELPLQLEGDMQVSSGSIVLAVTEKKQSFVFKNIPNKPVPSLLRNFSAPVKLQMDYSRDDLMFLMSHDTDGFARWEASQQLALQIIDELLISYRADETLVLDQRLIQAIRVSLEASLKEPLLDKAMIANLIVLPAEAYVAELAGEIDVDGIHFVREFVRKEIATELQLSFADVYKANVSTEPYVFNAGAIAGRSLKNTALSYLMLLDNPQWIECCDEQCRHSDNMTDTSAALRILVNSDSELTAALKNSALQEFYDKWKHDVLVVDQWFSMQASAPLPDNLARVKELVLHKAFDIKNPNKVRAVIGTFCNQNPVGFHNESGEGYEFLGNHVLTLDSLNPQIASRLLTPLTRWKKHNLVRQKLMQEQLQRIMESEPSNEVYEVVSKSLKA